MLVVGSLLGAGEAVVDLLFVNLPFLVLAGLLSALHLGLFLFDSRLAWFVRSFDCRGLVVHILLPLVFVVASLVLGCASKGPTSRGVRMFSSSGRPSVLRIGDCLTQLLTSQAAPCSP